MLSGVVSMGVNESRKAVLFGKKHGSAKGGVNMVLVEEVTGLSSEVYVVQEHRNWMLGVSRTWNSGTDFAVREGAKGLIVEWRDPSIRSQR